MRAGEGAVRRVRNHLSRPTGVLVVLALSALTAWPLFLSAVKPEFERVVLDVVDKKPQK